jgi:broad specificity phosphatase PhoE
MPAPGFLNDIFTRRWHNSSPFMNPSCIGAALQKKPFVAVLIALLAVCGARRAAIADQPKPLGPAVVLIIRHGEKPEGKDPNLAPRGYERADALATVIPAHFPKPDFLIATKKSAHSDRPVETITPLAKAMHLEISHEVKDDDFAEVTRSVLTDPKYAGKVVLIAWHHGKIPELAHALGAKDAPDKWDGEEVFDRVWQITYDKGVATWQDLPEHALPGDSDK